MSIVNIQDIAQASMVYMDTSRDLIDLQTFDEKTSGFFSEQDASSFPLISDEPDKITDWGNVKDVPNDMGFCDLIVEQDLLCEKHNVTTTDGYILTMFRVRDPVSSRFKKDAKAVFVQHGLLADCNDWILQGSNSLSVKLAQAGYDTWFGNNRGTRYSRGHTHLNPEKSQDQKEYYNYSFYELGKFDQPAMIDYVRGVTKQNKLTYMAHSQGTSQMFSALAENHGELNNKLDLFIAMAPIVKMFNTESTLLRDFSIHWRGLQTFTDTFNVHSINWPVTSSLLPLFCTSWPSICSEADKAFSQNGPYDNPDADAVDSQEVKSGCSFKELLHYGQEIINITGDFKQYDYGSDKANIAVYGTKVVPQIDLDMISVDLPIYLYSGEEDPLADIADVKLLIEKLGSRIKHWDLIPNFDHGAFSTGKYLGWIELAMSHIEKA